MTTIEKENGSSSQRARTLFESGSFKRSRENATWLNERWEETKSLETIITISASATIRIQDVLIQKRKRRVKSKNIIIVDNRWNKKFSISKFRVSSHNHTRYIVSRVSLLSLYTSRSKLNTDQGWGELGTTVETSKRVDSNGVCNREKIVTRERERERWRATVQI